MRCRLDDPRGGARWPVSALYDEWAPTYDDDVAAWGYVGARQVADEVAGLVPPSTDVLDVGCGTGLVGAALAEHGFTSVDGLDISPAMLAKARARRVYHDLGPADLTERLPGAGRKFGVVTSAGTFAEGHLGPDALASFARVVRDGGHIVATVLPDTWQGHAYDDCLRSLESRGVVRLVEAPERPYRRADDVRCLLMVLEVRHTPDGVDSRSR